MENLRILVVDDIYTNRLLLSKVITSAGHEVVLAENGQEALEILENEVIHLVFMDIEMPVMNGIETTHHIRNNMLPPVNGLPVVALTAHNPELFAEEYEGSGFDELITKPYSAEKIRKLVSDLAGPVQGTDPVSDI